MEEWWFNLFNPFAEEPSEFRFLQSSKKAKYLFIFFFSAILFMLQSLDKIKKKFWFIFLKYPAAP